MLTETQIKSLIHLKTESKNLDYKESLHWVESRDGRLELVRDLLAMGNTQDGGQVILGVNDETFDAVGMPEADWKSFDQTKVNEFAQKFAGPVFSCQVYKHLIDGRRHVCVEVPEFTNEPLICRADANSSTRPEKLILQAGALYIRTRKGTTEKIRTAEDMRELLGRAVRRKGDDLLRNIEQLIKGRPSRSDTESRAKYQEEINGASSALLGRLREAMGEAGYWHLIARPTSYMSRRIREIQELRNLVQSSEVSLRGWTFPKSDRKDASNFAEGRESRTIWDRYIEGYRAYRSGLFVWYGALWEDVRNYRTSQGAHVLDFPGFVLNLTEFLLFFKRFYEQVGPDSVTIQILLNGMAGRRMVSEPSIIMPSGCACSEQSISNEETVTLGELKASHDEIAKRFVKHILALFNCEQWADEEALEEWQRRLYERRL